MAVIVHYVKHWDNDTRGTIEIANATVAGAITQAERVLEDEILDENVLGQLADLYTITKAEIAQGSNWTGAPMAGF